MSEQFDPKEIKGAFVDLNTAFDEFKKANDDRLKEIEAKGASDVVTDEKLDKINDAMTKAQDRMDKMELAQRRAKRVSVDVNGQEVDLDRKALEWARHVSGDRRLEYGDTEMKQYQAAFEMMLRTGEEKMGGTEEIKSLSVGSDPDGGYVVHPDMSGRVVEQVFETSAMRSYASIQTISTDALEGLFDLDEAVAGWVGETAARPDTDTPELGKWRIPVHELYAKPKATQKVLEDAAINIEQWLSMKVADKFGRVENAAFTSGDGVNKPRGFLTYPDGTTLPGTMEQVATGVSGDFPASPDGGDVLIDALYALKAPYRANATWFMNRSTTKGVRKLKDSDGQYLWAPGIAAGQPATVLGYPTASFEDMPNIAANSLSIAVGDMRQAYQIVDRLGISVLRDPYSAKPYVEFYTRKRTGGDVVNFEALKLIRFGT